MAVDTSQPITPANAVGHPLMFTWVLWELKPGNKSQWNESLQQVAMFDTVEGFWKVHNNAMPPSQLPLGSDYYLFREGIKPSWEDKMNERGGRWQAILPNKQVLSRDKASSNFDKCWLELLMSVVGAQYGGFDNLNICGVAAHMRRNQDKVAVWISDASDGESRERIGRIIQEKLQPVNLSDNPQHGHVVSAHFTFDTHTDSFRRYEVGTLQRDRVHSSTPYPYNGGGKMASDQMKQPRTSAPTVSSNATA